MPARCFDCVDFVLVCLFLLSQSMLLPRGCSSWDWTRWALVFSCKAHTHGTRLEARRTEAAGRCESSGQRWQRRGEGEGETKQNTGDKTTGEPAIRRQDVANVDLLSTGLTVQESK